MARRADLPTNPTIWLIRVDATWIEPSGEEIKTRLRVGANLLEAAHENNIDLEGACECSLACSTCHVILDQDVFDSLPEPSDEENDMWASSWRTATVIASSLFPAFAQSVSRLDMAYGLTETSRLGCQVKITPEMDGIRIRLPSATRNFAVDGFVPKPH